MGLDEIIGVLEKITKRFYMFLMKIYGCIILEGIIY
jgi:hypothetical protein